MTEAPRAYQLCTRTVMDTSDPDIWFDEHGVSSHALFYDEHQGPIVEAGQSGALEPELQALVATIKRAGEGKQYDCVVGISGGVDSTYLALRVVELGLRPLAVHFDSGWNSELAVNNIENIVAKLRLDLYTDVVDWREMRDLQLSFFKASVANCDIPTDHAFASVAFEQAKKYGISYILSGHNLVSESVLPKAWGYDSGDARHVKGIQKRFGSVPLKTYPTLSKVKRHVYYEIMNGISSVALLNLMPYDYPHAKTVITEKLGWRDYGGKHYESVFTRYFQGYYLPMKFGFDKRRAHLSSLILSGQITRDEALTRLETSDYPEVLREQDHKFIAKKLGVTTTELEAIYARPPVDHLKYPYDRLVWPITSKLLRFAARATKPFRR